MSIAWKLAVLGGAFVIVTAGAIIGLSYQLSRSAATTWRLAQDARATSTASLDVIKAAIDAQSVMRKLVCETDADIIERLIDERKDLSAALRDRVAKAGSGNAAALDALRELEQTNEKVASAVLLADYAQAHQALLAQSNPAFDKLLRSIESLHGESQKAFEQSAAGAAESASAARTQVTVLTVTAVIALLVLSFFLVRAIVRSLGHAVSELAQAAGEITSGADHVSTSANALAQGASEQAATLEETSAAAEEINSIAARTADSSQSIAALMQETAKNVGDTNHRVDQLVASMKDISASSDKISKIIKVIDEIAFQTNILALNAAVEAARAGEAGAGFAVVADEVRNLAQRCAQAASETTHLIQDSVTKAGEGNLRLGRVADSMKSVTDAASKVKLLVDELSVSAQEQTRGLTEIARSVSQMQEVTHRSAAGAEEGAAAGEQLASQSQVLYQVIEELTGLIGVRR